MPDIIDLSTLLGDEPRDDDSKIDRSGRPNPKDVRVLLNSGIEIKCDVRYDGINPDRQRRFTVIAEIDWENYWPKELRIGEYPRDVTLLFRVPGLPDDQLDAFCQQMVVLPEHIIEV